MENKKQENPIREFFIGGQIVKHGDRVKYINPLYDMEARGTVTHLPYDKGYGHHDTDDVYIVWDGGGYGWTPRVDLTIITKEE